jgi:phosphatidylserine/phosphatidylglycerophosphate/cardiolipin synthase-like enzyme
MSYWTAARDYLVDELRRLAGAGCDVAIVVNPDTAEAAIESALAAAFDADHLAMLPGVHHKYLVVDGGYAGDPAAHLVWTGTQDFTAAALRDNDEVMLRLDSAAFRDRFLADWNAMFAAR